MLTFHHVFSPSKQKIIATFIAGVFTTESRNKDLIAELIELKYIPGKVRDMSLEDVQSPSLVIPKVKTMDEVDASNKAFENAQE